MRKFKNGAIRSSGKGKIDWYGVYHPLVENSFGNYMKKHTKTEDGETREYDNWWGGWDKKVSLQSMLRHIKDLQDIHAGYFVYKVKDKEGERTVVLKKENPLLKDFLVSEEDCLNAIRFNSNAYLLNIIL